MEGWPASADSPEALYRARAEAFRLDAAGVTVRFNRIANLRLAAFGAAAAGLIWGLVQAAPIALGAAVVLGIAFVVLVRYHWLLGRRRDRASALARINTEAFERLGRRWSNVPLRHTLQADRLHPYAADLDLFGHASLLHLLDTTRTTMGLAALAGWLLHGASPSTVRERQCAMAELTAQLEFRQELEVRGALGGEARRGDGLAARPSGPGMWASTVIPADAAPHVAADSSMDLQADEEPFLTWAESPPWLIRRRGLLWVARVSPVLLCLSAAAQALGLLGWPLWLVFLFVNAALRQIVGTRAYTTLTLLSTQEGVFRQYADSFQLLSGATFEAPLLQRLLGVLSADGRSAYAHMRTLERLTRLVLPRSAQVYWVLQSILLWDVHVLAALEGWQVRVGACTRPWLTALGEIEALAALAALAHGHPDWAIPEIDATASRLEAQQAGHPLLPPDRRIDNDLALGPVGTFLLVTGSNMAGKSTFLRTIGTNIVLAQAGGPVCARTFHMPPLDLCTSMRIADSLDRGVSTFLAEVLRLKQVVDLARGERADRPVCYLLDEILQGTNTAERQIAARQVIGFLLKRRALGAVSTHDLTLADAPELAAAAQRVHFSETLANGPGGPIMTFDYRLEPGPATSTNALRLVALLGLDDELGKNGSSA